MKSSTTEGFWKLFEQLPDDIQRRARKTYEYFEQNPFHPGLNFEEVDKQHNIWSARVNQQYRVVGSRRGDEIRWFWIGTHGEYDKLIGGKK